jgi:glycosyltransferase involved in cell wall biosynthesis
VEFWLNQRSVVIPSIRKEIVTLQSLKGLPIEIIVERTKNLSKARNIGVMKCSGDIIAILDDDLVFPQELFQRYIEKVRPGLAFWSDPPFILFITKADFIKSGGFDENISWIGEGPEFILALRKTGIKLGKVDLQQVRHLKSFRRGTFKEDWVGWKHNTLAWTRYYSKRKWWKIIFWIKDPRKLFKIFIWVLYWSLRGGQPRKSLQHN